MNVSRAQRGRKEPCETCVEEGSCKHGRKTHTGKTEQKTLRERFKGSGGRGMERFAQRSTYFLLLYWNHLLFMLIVSCGFCWISVQAACEQLMLIFLGLDFCYAKFFVIVLLQGEDHAKDRWQAGRASWACHRCKWRPVSFVPSIQCQL